MGTGSDGVDRAHSSLPLADARPFSYSLGFSQRGLLELPELHLGRAGSGQ